jgi:hypothetical protein
MGRRELFIALGFLLTGVVVWQFTAPPSTGEGGFSLRDLWNRAKREIQEDSHRAAITRRETVAVGPAVRTLRLIELPRGLKIIGESRDDVLCDLSVESTGPTTELAKEYAGKVALEPDPIDDTLGIRISYPEEATQRAQLTLRVPDRLAVHVQGVRGVEASGLDSLHLDGVSGDSTARAIRGRVYGTHSAGVLTIADADAVKLTLLPGSQARIERVRNGLTIDARNGELEIAETAGALEVTGLNEEISIARHAGTVRVGGSGGRVELDGPTDDSRIDMRRAGIEVRLAAPVGLALLTTDEPIELTLDGPPPIVLDAIATSASIDADAFALTPNASGADARLSHVFAPGATARVSLRNLRGDIVIEKVK